MHAAVRGVQQRSVRAGDPTFSGVDKSYVQQIGVNARSLLKPGATAIGGCKHSTSRTDNPAQTGPHKAGRDKSRTRAVADNTVVPGRAAVAGLQDGCARAYEPAVLFVYECAAQQQKLCRQSLS